MLILADIGNTNIVFAIYEKDEQLVNWRVYSDVKKTGDEYYIIIKSLLDNSNLDYSKIDKAIISSVVPNLTMSVEKIFHRLSITNITIVTHDMNTGLIRDSIPGELGTDLLCNLAYAHNQHPDKDVMVIDFGTALTFSTVDKTGYVKGVAILPGIITSVNALFGSTAQLPQVDLKLPHTILGRNSIESIRSGIMYGYKGIVETIIKQTEEELNTELFVILTGGLSVTISPLINSINYLDKNHTLNGLKLLSDLN